MSEGRLKSVFYGTQHTKYLSRFHLPRGYKLHVFHRGDEDADPHDHPWDFWTFPLTSYWEEYLEVDPVLGIWVPRKRLVRAWRWHHRSAEHVHRVLGKRPVFEPGVPQRIITLIKIGPERRQWGFWVPSNNESSGKKWVLWKTYLGV